MACRPFLVLRNNYSMGSVMSGSAPYMSLAYSIEISFILNLTYHELKSFQLRDEIKRKTDPILTLYSSEVSEEFVNCKNLVDFAEGKGDGWKHGDWMNDKLTLLRPWKYPLTCKIFYKLVRGCLDRRIVEGLMIIDFIILVAITILNKDPDFFIILNDVIYSLADYNIWNAAFITVIMSVLIPTAFMLISAHP